LYELEASIFKASKGEAVVDYCEPVVIKAVKALPGGLRKPPALPKGEN
jgi:hypothetical protein